LKREAILAANDQPAPKVRIVTVDDSADGQRIDNFLLRHLKGAPRTLIYRLLRKGEVRVNKGRVKPTYKLQPGDQVRIPPVRLAEPTAAKLPTAGQREAILDAVLYEDERLMIVNKPSGWAVHGGSGISLGVIEALRSARPELKQLELAHRLDRDTSGCLMLAKKRSALRLLQELQRRGGIEKRYLALLAGRWRKGRAEVDAPLRKNTLAGGERVVRVDPAGKPSRTFFRVVKSLGEATLVEATLDTGRTHQIRVHAAYLGTPILGDPKYGDAEANKRLRKIGLKRLFLHAHKLAFTWPDTGKKFTIHAPLPPELQAVIDTLET
jgi:23S rRNA pseudouridine955/2504/2580 synthase